MKHDDDDHCPCMEVMRERVIHETVTNAADSFLAIATALTPPDDGEEVYDPTIVALMVDMLTSEVICRISARGTEAHAVGLHAKNVLGAIAAHRASQKGDLQ